MGESKKMSRNYRRRLLIRKRKALALLDKGELSRKEVAAKIKVSLRRLYQLMRDWDRECGPRNRVA